MVGISESKTVRSDHEAAAFSIRVFGMVPLKHFRLYELVDSLDFNVVTEMRHFGGKYLLPSDT